MAYRDLRDFMAQLEATGDLRRVHEPVSPHLEMTALSDRVLRARDHGHHLVVHAAALDGQRVADDGDDRTCGGLAIGQVDTDFQRTGRAVQHQRRRFVGEWESLHTAIIAAPSGGFTPALHNCPNPCISLS